MYRIKKIVVFIFLATALKAQINLVPNPSFENYTACPTSQGQVSCAIGWSVTRFTADYFNTCASAGSGVNVPTNATGGFQYPASGNAYMGFYTYYPASPLQNRESIGCKLLNQLSIGTKYYVSFKVNLSNVDQALWANSATDHFGVLFSTVQFSNTAPVPINNFAQVYSTTIVTDTLNWTKVFGAFIADSAYKYISLGNFFDDVNTNKFFFCSAPDSSSYYFVDDICVSTDSTYSNNWFWTWSIENNLSEDYIISPNPSDTYITVSGLLDNSEILISDAFGKIVYHSFRHESDNINLKDYPNGVYILEIRNHADIRVKKIIINH